MKLDLLKQTLFLLYISSILCDYIMDFSEYAKYGNDVIACNSYGEDLTAEKCKENEDDSLPAQGDWANNCCFLNYTMDRTYSLKLLYPDNWEEMIKLTGSVYTDYEQCFNVIKEGSPLKNFFLYNNAVNAKNGEIKYDCGDGEITFKASEYNPTNLNEISLKEIIDCRFNYNQSDCTGKTKQFQSSTQCCWFTTTVVNVDDENDNTTINMCYGLQGFSREDFSLVQSTLVGMGASKNIGFNCADKNGKKVNGTYDLNYYSVNIDVNEQYSSYLRIGFLWVIYLLIALV